MTTKQYFTLLDKRVSVLFSLSMIVFLGLLVRLLSLQIGQEKIYSARSFQNRMRDVPVPAARGKILDRHGLILADSVPRFDLWYFPAPDREWKEISAAILQQSQQAGLSLSLPSTLGSSSVPVRVQEDLGLDVVSFIEERRREIPGFETVVAPRRIYPLQEALAHVLGYVGKPSKSDLKNASLKNPSRVQRIGKSGLERQYDIFLRGRPGRFRTLVDGMGRFVQRAQRQDPVRGWDLSLAISANLQETAWALLKGKRGSIVAMDPRNGDVLAMASNPSFDPNLLSRKISTSEWALISMDPASPLENRAIAGLYPPGSVFKIVTATAGLETGVLDSKQTKFCIGMWQYHGSYAWPFFCHHSHGTVDINQAIYRSCNIYFFKSAVQIKAAALNRYALMYGFGQKTGIDLPLEASGLVPNPAWRRRAKGISWVPGDTIHMAIGQGDVLVTPLQLTAAYAAIAAGGLAYIPRLVLSATNKATGEKRAFPPKLRQRNFALTQETQRILRKGFRNAVRASRGTAKRARIPGIEVAAKTGTAQPGRGETHALFVGYAPAKDPRIVITVVLENSGEGGLAAAPPARYLLEEFFGKPHRESLKVILDEEEPDEI